MAQHLPSVLITPSMNGVTQTLNTGRVTPGSVSAIRLFNNTPYVLLLQEIPGVGELYLPQFTEDIYKTSDSIYANYNQSKGYIKYTPFNVSNLADTSSAYSYQLFPTVYEIGDELPDGLPIVHVNQVAVINDVSLRNCTLGASGSISGGTGATINLSIPDDANGTQYFTVLQGFSIDFTNSSAQHNALMTITGCFGITMNFELDIPTGTGTTYSYNKNNLNWRSTNFGAAASANQITITVPAISSGPAYTVAAWGYGIPISVP